MDFTFKNFAVFFLFVTVSNIVFEIIAHQVRMFQWKKEVKRINGDLILAKMKDDEDNTWH